ncbi:MAG: cupredoxin domain-containing protein, partial [Terriglobia bacterium]
MRLLWLALLVSLAMISPSLADDFSLTIKDHRFTPSEIHVPANTPARLEVANEDATAEEFD